MTAKRKPAFPRKGLAAKEAGLNICHHCNEKRTKNQGFCKPKHGDISGFYVRIYDERHANFILKPVDCGYCATCNGRAS